MAQIASITLQNNDDARPIIDAIMADNPGIQVMNMPGAVKLDRENSIIVKRETVEENLGREWDPQEMHLVIVSMAGNLDEDDDYFALCWNR